MDLYRLSIRTNSQPCGLVSIKYCHVDTENSPACLLCQTAVWFRPRPGPSSHSYCYRVFSEVVLFSDLAAVFVHA